MQAVQQPAGFPVATRCARAAVGGRDTDLLVCDYQDAVLLMASQTGTVGTVVLAKQDSALDGKTTFSTSVLLGKRDEPLLLVAARQLVELAHSRGATKPVICCLALREHTADGIRQLLAAVKDGGLL